MSDITVAVRKTKICERIKSERIALGKRKKCKISQEGLAAMIAEKIPGYEQNPKQLGQSSISEWESGKRLPTMEQFLAMAEVFGCDCAYLLGDYDERILTESDICLYTGLSETVVEFMHGEVEAENQLIDLPSELRYPNPPYIPVLNFLFENCSGLMLAFLSGIYKCSKIQPKIENSHKLYREGVAEAQKDNTVYALFHEAEVKGKLGKQIKENEDALLIERFHLQNVLMKMIDVAIREEGGLGKWLISNRVTTKAGD